MAACTELVARGDEEGLLEWLDEEERDLNLRDEQGRTPLDLATILGREGIIRVLVERGADVNLANASGSNHVPRGILTLHTPSYDTHMHTLLQTVFCIV